MEILMTKMKTITKEVELSSKCTTFNGIINVKPLRHANASQMDHWIRQRDERDMSFTHIHRRVQNPDENTT